MLGSARVASVMVALQLLPSAAAAQAALGVEIVEAALDGGGSERSLTGEIAARNPVTVAFLLAGRIASIAVDEGAVVAEGDELGRLDSVQQEQSLRAAQAGEAKAAADLAQARTDADRQTALLDKGATTRTERDDADDALRVAEGAKARASAELDLARKALDDTVLDAPGAGLVTDRRAEPGEVVRAAQPVLDVALGQALDAVFDVPEALIAASDVAPVVRLQLIEGPDATFTGMVREVSPLVDPEKGTVRVKLALSDVPAGLTIGIGQSVRGTVRLPEPPHVTLPFEAISSTKGGPAVWVVDPAAMTVSLRPVTVARYETDRIVLGGGLEAGEKVVAKGSNLLYPGRKVMAVGAGG